MKIRERLERHELGFYLCGSRAIGNAREDSDYDYVTLDRRDVHRYLRRQGLERMKPHWLDCITNSVYRGKDIDGCQIDVAVVTDVDAKLRVVGIMKERPILQAVDLYLKSKGGLSRLNFWDALYRIAGAPARARSARER